MPFAIRNTQEKLRRELGRIYPTVSAHLGEDDDWHVVGEPKKFATRSAAAGHLAASGLAEGRHENKKRDYVNTIDIVEVA